MKTIEERADAYVGHPEEIDEFTSETLKRYAYIAGATEQKAIDETVRLKKSDDMTEAEYNREIAFVDWYLKNGKGTPTFSDAIEWARRELIDKACDWLKGNARDYACATVRCPYGEEEEIICDVHLEILEDFRKAMEE